MADYVKEQLEARRTIPAATTEGAIAPARGSRFGEAYGQLVGKGCYALADEGSYFVASNPTPGTGIAGIAATGAFSDAESLLVLKNTYTAAEGKRIYLDRLHLIVTAAGANGTDHRYVSKIDTGVERYTSGGSTITPVNVNHDASSTLSATCYFGALVTTSASSNVRLIQSGLIRSVIAVVGDKYTFDYGADHVQPTGMVLEGTAQCHAVIPHAPIVLPPGCTYVLSLHAASQTGATSYEFNLGFWVR